MTILCAEHLYNILTSGTVVCNSIHYSVHEMYGFDSYPYTIYYIFLLIKYDLPIIFGVKYHIICTVHLDWLFIFAIKI